MMIYRCDGCGNEHKFAHIAGNEFVYMKLGFESLRLRGRTVDLCKKCKVEFEQALRGASNASHAFDLAERFIAEKQQTPEK